MKKDRRMLYWGIFCFLLLSYSFLLPNLFWLMIFGESLSAEENVFGVWAYVIPAVTTVCSLILIIVVRVKDRIERKEIEEAILNSGIEQIDNLTPFEFETWIAEILHIAGFETKTTKKSGDYGIDVLAEMGSDRIGIQVKKYSKDVGIKAVQEVISGMSYYNCTSGWVITSAQSFTTAAKNLAKKNSITLIGRTDLALMLNKIKNQNL